MAVEGRCHPHPLPPKWDDAEKSRQGKSEAQQTNHRKLLHPPCPPRAGIVTPGRLMVQELMPIGSKRESPWPVLGLHLPRPMLLLNPIFTTFTTLILLLVMPQPRKPEMKFQRRNPAMIIVTRTSRRLLPRNMDRRAIILLYLSSLFPREDLRLDGWPKRVTQYQ